MTVKSYQIRVMSSVNLFNQNSVVKLVRMIAYWRQSIFAINSFNLFADDALQIFKWTFLLLFIQNLWMVINFRWFSRKQIVKIRKKRNPRDCKQRTVQILDMVVQFRAFVFQLSIVIQCLSDHFGRPAMSRTRHSPIEHTNKNSFFTGIFNHDNRVFWVPLCP